MNYHVNFKIGSRNLLLLQLANKILCKDDQTYLILASSRMILSKLQTLQTDTHIIALNSSFGVGTLCLGTKC